MTTTPTRPVATLTVRCPEDLLALAPAVLGFWPEESVVMLTFGTRRPFHARLDLPSRRQQRDDAGVLPAAVDALLGPALRHRVPTVVFLHYSADGAAVRALHTALRRGCRAAGIRMLGSIWTDGERYRELLSADRAHREIGTPYDVSDHPFVLQAVVEGRLHHSRGDMVASLEADPAAIRAVEAELAHDACDDGLPTSGREIRAAGGWVERHVAGWVEATARPRAAELARLLRLIQETRVRDAAWSLINARTAEQHVAFWTQVVRSSPPALLAPPAALLAWSAWQAGDGALSWAALDRCREAEPDYPLALYLATILQEAVPPEVWEGGFDWSLGLAE